jgi:hypothetical protein
MRIKCYFIAVQKKYRNSNPKEHNKKLSEYVIRSSGAVSNRQEVEKKLLAYIDRIKNQLDIYSPTITISVRADYVPSGWLNQKKRTATRFNESSGFVCVYQYNVETKEERDLISQRTNGRKSWRDLP